MYCEVNNMLKIENLNVCVGDKKILNDFNIDIKDGEIHAIMGPNGTGKSTLSKVIMGSKNYNIESGNIIFNGKKINSLKTDERARLGLFISMQNPISIEGVSNSEFLKTAINARRETPIGLFEFVKTLESKAKELNMKDEMIHRAINVGASGGERKKNEVLQIELLEPSFIILDELDSGLDVDSLKVVCESINKYLQRKPDTQVLIITHYPRILEYIKPKYVHILNNGQIACCSHETIKFINQVLNQLIEKNVEKNGYGKINSVDGNR